MPSAASLAPPTPVLPDSPAPKKMPRATPVQHEQNFFPHDFSNHELDLFLSRPATPSIHFQPQSPLDSDHGTNTTVPQYEEVEDEYTISAYGDISQSEVVVPSLSPPHSKSGALHATNPLPCLRLKMQRPPMPKRRPGYNHIADPLSRSGSMDLDERWPGSPRPIKDNKSWQPLVSPLPVDSLSPQTQGSKLGASLDRLVSPPGSLVSRAINLPQNGDVERGRPEINDTPADQLRSKPAPSVAPATPLQERPWRTRLPSRPPMPKWDM